MEKLPNELLEHVLASLSERCLTSSRRVSRRWKDLCERSICRKRIVNVVIACPGVKPFIQGVDNVLVANESSSKSMLSFLTHVRRASVTFSRKQDMKPRDEKVLVDFVESFVKKNKDSLESLYLNNSGIEAWICLPHLPLLHHFFMDRMDAQTLNNLIAACPSIQSLRFRTIDSAPFANLPKGLKVLANKFVDDEHGNWVQGSPLDLTALTASPAIQTIEVLSLTAIPDGAPETLSMPNLEKVAFSIDEEDHMNSLPHLLSAAPHIKEILLKVNLRWIEEEEMRLFWNRVFARLKNLIHLRLEGCVSTELFAAVGANCSNLQSINCRTYRCHFDPTVLLQLLSLDQLRKIDIVTDTMWGIGYPNRCSLTAIRQLVEQKPRVGIKIFMAMRPMSRSPGGALLLTQFVNSLPGRAEEHLCDIGPIRKPYHPGSCTLRISPALQQ